ncbi:uncharacterized protein LOC128229359 isoform X2 [Mya arenaria]|uniref:uncharacterized protein LOC128229359 isoform X2 n=1 Tax=Mya arenaria TaxID=6604 RepID=UPI0022E1FEE1|nr:uncharacterized protein LOC128229359 isoform X2 [Mya arenaria]
MFDGVIAAFDDLGLRWQKKQSEIADGGTKCELKKEISQLKAQLEMKEIRNSDFQQEIRDLAKDIKNWEEVENLQNIGKDTSTYLRDLRTVRILISRKKQDDLTIIKRLREEIGNFENELKHWSDLTEVNRIDGLDSEFCVALRRLREKTFERKKQSFVITENMRIAEDELKQLKLEVFKWEQLETVNNLHNPKYFHMALDVNEIRIAIVNIKKIQQGSIHSFEAKMKEFKSLCKYIMDDEVNPIGGERTSSDEPDVKVCISCIRRWKEDRQNTQLFVEENFPLLQSSLIRLKSKPYSFHEPKRRKDIKLRSEVFSDIQLCVYQLVDCIKYNDKRFTTSYIDCSKALQLIREHYFALTSEQYPLPRKETPYEIIIQNITDRLVQLGITKHQIAELVEEKNSLALRLNKATGAANLRENNPNIAELSDPNRPTKLSERYSELYDNQWTNAFEKLIDGKRCTEKRAIDCLLEIF